MTKRATLPLPRMEGDAGTGNPTDRETRYSQYADRQHQSREEQTHEEEHNA